MISLLLDCFIINTMKEMVSTFIVKSPWHMGFRGRCHSSVKFHTSANGLNPSAWQVNLAEFCLISPLSADWIKALAVAQST